MYQKPVPKTKFNPEKEVEGLCNFIKEEVEKAGKSGCIVGVSGGIDSAVTAILCKKVKDTDIFGVSIPEDNHVFGSTEIKDSGLRARELCEKFEIPLCEEKIHFDLDSNFVPPYKYTVGNYLARKRMAVLYYYAECLGYLVVGTDNACESYIGYFTKYGDGGVDINPLGQYLKSEVYTLGEYLGVPESILNCAPTAELFDNQTDEGELGFTYDELEDYILLPDGDVPKYLQEVGQKIKFLHLKTEHKRELPKVYRRITEELQVKTDLPRNRRYQCLGRN